MAAVVSAVVQSLPCNVHGQCKTGPHAEPSVSAMIQQFLSSFVKNNIYLLLVPSKFFFPESFLLRCHMASHLSHWSMKLLWYQQQAGVLSLEVSWTCKGLCMTWLTAAGKLRASSPLDGCQSLADNAQDIQGGFAFLERGTCMFAEKVRMADPQMLTSCMAGLWYI